MRRLRKSLVDRFWDKFSRPDTGCWNWTGATTSSGYGQIGRSRSGSGKIVASRVAWMLWFGPVPDGLFVLHSCDNRLCVRPDHLFLGTKQDNAVDCINKGRYIGAARLDSLSVNAIRQRRYNGESEKSLAQAYHVHRSTINRIVNRKRWNSGQNYAECK